MGFKISRFRWIIYKRDRDDFDSTLEKKTINKITIRNGIYGIFLLVLLTACGGGDADTPDALNLFTNPQGITLDSANNRALVVDSGLDAVIAVDLTTRARTVLSDKG